MVDSRPRAIDFPQIITLIKDVISSVFFCILALVSIAGRAGNLTISPAVLKIAFLTKPQMSVGVVNARATSNKSQRISAVLFLSAAVKHLDHPFLTGVKR